MKKLGALLVAVCLGLFCLAGCQSTEGSSDYGGEVKKATDVDAAKKTPNRQGGNMPQPSLD